MDEQNPLRHHIIVDRVASRPPWIEVRDLTVKAPDPRDAIASRGAEIDVADAPGPGSWVSVKRLGRRVL